MQRKRTAALLTLLLASLTTAPAREAKEGDNDVSYDEGRIPHYDVPPLLVTSGGKHVREGGHSIETHDWQRFLDFADHHLKRAR